MHNPFSLYGKTILITGASSGIGRAIAIACSQMKANVIITARNQQRLQETFELLEGEGNIQIIADLSDINQLSDLVKKLPKLDGVASNAGIVRTLITQVSEANDVSEIFLKLTPCPIHLIQFLLQNKIEQECFLLFSYLQFQVYIVEQ